MEGPRIAGKKGIDLLKEIIPVCVKSEKGIIEIPLENTVGAIHRTIGHRVDDMVSAANMVRSSRTRLQTFSIKTGKEKTPFTNPDGILYGERLFDERSLILNPFHRDVGETF
jgi:hypothetical protein